MVARLFCCHRLGASDDLFRIHYSTKVIRGGCGMPAREDAIGMLCFGCSLIYLGLIGFAWPGEQENARERTQMLRVSDWGQDEWFYHG